MDDIRKRIEQNRNLFDDQEPSSGHMERFGMLLKNRNEQEHKRKKKARLITILSVAASIAVLAAMAVRFYTPGDSSNGVPAPEIISAADEFKTTNDYYNQKMEEKIADIMCKLAYTDSENQARLTKDIQQIVDSNSDFINEIVKSEDKEAAIHYLVKHYKTNIDVLENIDEKLGRYTEC
jgi:flagellar basal body-associated protein FliL